MNWKKSIFVVMLAGTMVFAVSGCGKAEETTPATEQPTATPEGTRPAPPDGSVPSDNRTSAPVMDLAAAAARLGVTEQQLREALGEQGQRQPDLAAAAKKLGIPEESLREALGLPEGAPPTGGTPPSGPKPKGQGQ